MQVPDNFFPGQHPDEKIVVFTRRHWIVMLTSVLAVVAGAAAYIGLAALLVYLTKLDLRGPAGLVLVTVSAVVFLMSWLLLYVKFVDYYLDVWILTDQRIVQVKQRSLFNREIAEFDLSTVQDVSSQVRGVVGTFLNYGKIFVQTAAARDLFEFRFIPNPTKVEEQILALQEQLEIKTKHDIGVAVQTGGDVRTTEMEQLKRRLPDLE